MSKLGFNYPALMIFSSDPVSIRNRGRALVRFLLLKITTGNFDPSAAVVKRMARIGTLRRLVIKVYFRVAIEIFMFVELT